MLIFARVMLGLLGVAAVGIGLMLFLLGPDTTARVFSWVAAVLTGATAYTGGLDHPNTDSELRFFAVFWLDYGLVLLWLIRDLAGKARWVFAALAVFFAGGVGRLLSLGAVGWPDPLFQALMVIELVGPLVVAPALWLGLRTAHS